MGKSRRILLAVSISIFLLAGVAQAQKVYREGEPQLSKSDSHTPGILGPNFSPLVRELSRSVVNISVEGPEEDKEAPPVQPKEGELPARAMGSGFIVTEDGYIITNTHVVGKGNNQIVVRLLDDKEEYQASIVGIDERTDIALVKINTTQKLHPVFLGDSEQVEVGEWVIAIGNQFQLGQTVTAGIVSAKSRRVPSSSAYDAFIQTDASINPGSSGGPLFNTRGQVIGINTAIFSPGRMQFGGTGFNIGIGFAIPINLAKGVVTQLREFRKVTRGLLGVMIQRIDKDMSVALGLGKVAGALVSDVVPGSPAARAGFVRKDVILEYDGKPIDEYEQLPLLVAATVVGNTVDIKVIRQGKALILKAVIEELKDSAKGASPEMKKPNKVGLLLSDRNALGGVEVMVDGVEPGSAAERAGLMRGDLIEEYNSSPVKNAEELSKLMDSLEKGKPALLLVKRPDGTRFFTLKTR